MFESNVFNLKFLSILSFSLQLINKPLFDCSRILMNVYFFIGVILNIIFMSSFEGHIKLLVSIVDVGEGGWADCLMSR